MPYWKRNYKPIDKSKILKQVFTDEDRIKVHEVISENDTYYTCYSGLYGMEYKVKKEKVYTDREELKYIRWARRTHEKTSKARQKLLTNTKKIDYKKRYIKEFPEYVI